MFRLVRPGLLAALLFSMIWGALHIMDRVGSGRINLSRHSISHLKPKTIQLLQKLPGDVHITYYASDRQRLPSDMRRLPEEVEELLEEMRRRSGKRVTWDRIDPTEDPELSKALGYKRINPFNVKSIRQDELSVNTIWSGLLIRFQNQERVIPHVMREHLTGLETRIMRQLGDIASPRPALVGLSMPWPDQGLPSMIAGGARLVPFNFDQGPIPDAADLAIIVQPRLNPARAKYLREYLAGGKSLFLFFSPARIAYHGKKGSAQKVSIVPEDLQLNTLLDDLGVDVPAQLAMDIDQFENNPSNILVRPFGFDLSRFKAKTAGNTVFPIASPIILHPARMKEAGWSAEILTHTTTLAWTRPVPGLQIPWPSFIRPADGPWERKGLNLGVMLRSEKPWEGKLFLFSSAYVVDDGALKKSPGNKNFIKNLLQSFTTDEYRMNVKANAEKPPTVPPLSSLTKILLRLFCVAMIPAFIIGFGIYSSSRQASAGTHGWTPAFAGVTAKFIAAPAAILTLLILWPISAGLDLDLTRDQSRRMDPATIQILQGLRSEVLVRYVTSPPDEMSLAGKQMINGVRERLELFRRYGNGRLTLTEERLTREQRADPEKRRWLEERGIAAVEMETIEQDVYRKRAIYSALVLEADGRREVITPLLPGSDVRLEFLMDAALQRLFGTPRPAVTLIAEQPRMTPAEAMAEKAAWQETISQSPDVFSEVRHLLATYGYSVQTLSMKDLPPADLQLPAGIKGKTGESPRDILKKYGYEEKSVSPEDEQSIQSRTLLYLQPFTMNDRLKSEIDRLLASGGDAIVAVQHFNIQHRIYKGRSFQSVYWPQPQFSRINEWLNRYGINLEHEVLMDENMKQAAMDTQVRWGAVLQEKQTMPTTLPFMIHTPPGQFNRASPITRRLSDQLFVGGNRFTQDPVRFPASLTWTPLITTSARAWAFAWKGGWIPEYSLKGGAPLGEQPLMVQVEGQFPSILQPELMGTQKARMILIGCSDMFKNMRIRNSQFRAAELLMNALVHLNFGVELARVHSKAVSTVEGFGYQGPSTRMTYRVLVLFLPPFLFILYGLGRWRYRARAAT